MHKTLFTYVTFGHSVYQESSFSWTCRSRRGAGSSAAGGPCRPSNSLVLPAAGRRSPASRALHAARALPTNPYLLLSLYHSSTVSISLYVSP